MQEILVMKSSYIRPPLQTDDTDDTKVYLSFSSQNIDSCLTKVASWCCTNKVFINPSKTKLILFGTQQLLSKKSRMSEFLFLVKPSSRTFSQRSGYHTRLKTGLTFNEHVNSLTSSLISTLCQISRVRHLFSKSVFFTILN